MYTTLAGLLAQMWVSDTTNGQTQTRNYTKP